jgi:hypothetical protein
MPEPPDRRRHQPGRPRSVGEDRHPRLRTRAGWCLLGIEHAKARDETLCISAPVGMMRSDEVPAAPPGRPLPVVMVADARHVAPVDADGNLL